MPRNLDASVSLSEVLALVQVLRQQLSDLKTVPPRSLARLVGVPAKGRRRPSVSKKVAARIALGKKEAGLPLKAADVELVKEGLRAVRLLPGGEAISPEEFRQVLAQERIRFEQAVEAPPSVRRPSARQSRARQLLATTRLACEVAVPVLAPFIAAPSPVVRGAALAAIAGCGLFQMVDEGD